jgi:hypothetical protein
MTGALFGASSQTFAASMNAGFTPSLYRRTRMEVDPMSYLLIIILGQKMWATWRALMMPSWSAPCTMVKRKDFFNETCV